ncbi:uncharacterized protein LOC106470296 [Limulus polyphemus]|uniref:Uncharacterized protein LOC106470296 n=1 Tax=Limulus polyphemus TaxID=6850 RepID=A0ABM1TFF8_LIMPO|nr:uncharacterized protein LOC106470296 [Limulus polyphemus]
MGVIEEGDKGHRKKCNLPDRNRNAPVNSTPTSRNSSIHRHEQQRQSSQNAEKDITQHVANAMSDQQTRDGSCRCVKGRVVLLWVLCVLSLGLSGLCGLRLFHVEERLTSLETKYRQLEMQHQEQQVRSKAERRRRRRETRAKSGPANLKRAFSADGPNKEQIKPGGFGPVGPLRSVGLPEFDSQKSGGRGNLGLSRSRGEMKIKGIMDRRGKKQKRDRHRKLPGRSHPVSGSKGDVPSPEDEKLFEFLVGGDVKHNKGDTKWSLSFGVFYFFKNRLLHHLQLKIKSNIMIISKT